MFDAEKGKNGSGRPIMNVQTASSHLHTIPNNSQALKGLENPLLVPRANGSDGLAIIGLAQRAVPR